MTECWPRGNAQAEGSNKPLMKAIRSAVVEQRNWKQEMYQFLRQYRATPHTSTKFSPHRLLFGREHDTTLPHVSTGDNHDNRPVHAAARENDKQANIARRRMPTRGTRPSTTICTWETWSSCVTTSVLKPLSQWLFRVSVIRTSERSDSLSLSQ